MSVNVVGKLMDASETHDKNAYAPMLVTAVAERLADVRPLFAKGPVAEEPVHPPSAMLVSVGGKATDKSDVQLIKAPFGMVVSCVEARSIDVRAVCRNAWLPMAVSVVGREIDWNEPHSQKAA